MKQKLKLRIYEKQDEDTWSSDYSELNITDIDASVGIKTTKDTWSFTLPNPNQINKDTVHIDDRIQIFFYTGSLNTSSDLIMDGNVTRITQTINEKTRKIKVQGSNRTEELLGVLVQLSFNNYQKDISEVIQEIIDKVNNQNRKITGDDKFISTNINSTKLDGSAFPKKLFTSAYKPAYELIEKYSTDEYTEDGSYMFWIDSNNTLHWTNKTTSLSSEDYKFDEADGNIRELKIDEGTWDVFNSAIVDVGRDAYNHGNHTLVYNPVSMVDTGTKWTFLDLSSTTPSLITKEFEDHSTQWDTGSEGELIGSFPKSYPYTCSFFTMSSSYEVGTSSWVVNSDTDFNLAIRRTARKIGQDLGQEILNKKGEKKYKIDITKTGTNEYAIGELAEITCASHNLSNKKVRIINISHNFNKNGWVTVLNTEEDPEIVGA